LEFFLHLSGSFRLKPFQSQSNKFLSKWLSVVALNSLQFGGEITAVPALHGHSWANKLMANGAGFYLQLPGEPSIYISGDTVYTEDVERALTEFKPDIAVMASGSASLDVGGPILMPMQELIRFVQNTPHKVIANHLEALNHCPTTRFQLKKELEKRGLFSNVFIPEDGEVITI
jgi:L-ascorbate metabolism protein UlaG (beta-lactamase superfamily)